jgi:hypothetical protein
MQDLKSAKRRTSPIRGNMCLISGIIARQRTFSNVDKRVVLQKVRGNEMEYGVARIAPREILPTGKILTSFPCPHFCVCHKVCARLKQILETPSWHVLFALSGKISHEASGPCRIPIYERQDEMFKKREWK